MSAQTDLDLNRFRGALLGLAVGDALGTTVEFRRPGSFEPLSDIVGGGPFRLEPGQWTDDTSLALCLAESLVERKEFDPFDQLDRYWRWYREGHLSSTGRCFDIGRTTHAALLRFDTERRLGTAADAWFGSTDPHSAGNGSIMRLAPVPMAFAASPRDAIRFAAGSSRTTHGATEAVDGCRYLAALLVGALRGVGREELLSERYSPVPGCWDEQPLAPAIDEIARGSFKVREPPEIKGTGYVVKSLEAALWAFHRSDDFRSGCLAAVNLGDDADTTGAVYGQIAGAFYGASGIPPEWIERIAMREKIEELARGLFEMAKAEQTERG